MIGATTLRRMRTTMTKVLEGKVAVVTGGNSGMGLATAMRFIAEGAHVVITGRRQEQIDIALKEIGSSKAIGVQGDVANMKDLDRRTWRDVRLESAMSNKADVRRLQIMGSRPRRTRNPYRHRSGPAL